MRADIRADARWGGTKWWGIGIGGGILYLIVLFTLGFTTLRKGNGWMFFLGIAFPLLWLIGAFMEPARAQTAS